MTGTPTSTTRTGRSLRWAVILLAAQAVAMGVLAAYVAWEAATTTAVSPGSAVATPVITVLGAVLFGMLAYALSGLRGWARGPSIVLEMLLIPIGYSMTSVGLPWVGVPLMVVGLVGAGLLLAPSTRTALGLDR